MYYTGFGNNQPAAMYTFGGGTFPRDFQVSSPYMGLEPNTLYQTWEMGPSGPQLSEAAKRFGVQVLPAGATGRQEMRYLVEEAKKSGRPYVEAPEKFVRGDPKKRWGNTLDSERLYNARTGAPYSGTIAINYSAGPWRNIKGEEMTTGGGYSPAIQASRARQGLKPEGPERGGYGGRQPSQGSTPPPVIPDRSLGMTAESPMAFTGFGRIVGESPYRTPTIPRFPYSNY